MLSLDVESLRTLIAVLDHGGMTPAARQLGLSQSAVSWKIKRFESRVGSPLLIRDGHDLRPTREGRMLLDDAREIVALHDRAAARLSTSGLVGTVRLGSNEEVDPTVMAGLIGEFRARHPGAEVEFRIDHTERLRDAVDTGELDVALLQVLDDDVRDDDTILWSDRLAWLTSVERAHATEPVPLVTFGEHCFYRAVSEPKLDAAGLDHRVVFSASSISGVRAAIDAGLGVGVLAARHAGDRLVPWVPDAEVDELPVIHQIARTVPGETPQTAALLIDALATTISEAA